MFLAPKLEGPGKVFSKMNQVDFAVGKKHCFFPPDLYSCMAWAQNVK